MAQVTLVSEMALSTWSVFVYYLFKGTKKQALSSQTVRKGIPFLCS